ncbi:MAG: LysE family translocator [Acetobacteraceae bacterium]
MDIHLFLAFCFAATILVLVPGPTVTVVVANSLRRGTRTGCATVAGANIGSALQLAAAVVGLATFFSLLSEVFTAIRWIGAAYLIGLGVKAWRARGTEMSKSTLPARPRSAHAVFLQGFLVAITNPKTIVFYIAFLPQFIDPRLPSGPQLLAMGSAMVVIALASDSTYAVLAGRVRGWLTAPSRRRLQARITGSLLIATGCGLLLARRGS